MHFLTNPDETDAVEFSSFAAFCDPLGESCSTPFYFGNFVREPSSESSFTGLLDYQNDALAENKFSLPSRIGGSPLATRSRTSVEDCTSDSSSVQDEAGKVQYYPGIQLKLGKERDTVIRPALTSIFREFRHQFRNALAEMGLRYGDLRMWRDAQLCTAIYIADSFRPGIWNTAAALHVKKTKFRKHRGPKRLRLSRAGSP